MQADRVGKSQERVGCSFATAACVAGSRAVDAAGIGFTLDRTGNFTEGALIEHSPRCAKAVKSLKSSGGTRRGDFGTGLQLIVRTAGTFRSTRHRSIESSCGHRVEARAMRRGDAILARAKSRRARDGGRGRRTEGTMAIYPKTRTRIRYSGFLFCRPLAIADLESWHTVGCMPNQSMAASVVKTPSKPGSSGEVRRESVNQQLHRFRDRRWEAAGRPLRQIPKNNQQSLTSSRTFR